MSNLTHLKTPLVTTLPFGVRGQIDDALQLLGKGLPCHVIEAAGPLITVAFDVTSLFTLPQITVPLFGPEYIRYPIQPGDKGYVIPVECPVGFSSGQASSPPDLSAPGNLEALYFQPIGNAKWQTVDGQAVVIYGPNGVTLRDTNSGAVIVLHPAEITVTIGSCTITMDASTISMNAPSKITLTAPEIELDGQMTQGTSAGGYPATLQGPVTVVNDVTAAGTSVHGHVHGGVTTGGDDTGTPV
ncbi:phage baseplate protein [Paraburkholderia sp. USG1]|uniref:phage baseplate protein n=1 Tax=Paraburkholderia sp. USG1 TaxID=2952268 RepID=UPI00285B531C|nr:phage baseplate protein [Paraburkholderia sp. USG1]MDR8399213.1 phage baseplate protein [Paraburkholderia sp. USG1]